MGITNIDLDSVWSASLSEAHAVLTTFMNDPIQRAACVKFSQLLTDTFRSGGKLLLCGNGGSHCDAMQFATEFTGRYRKDRVPLGALALGDASHMTCVSNDYGFEDIFARQVTGLARKGDMVVGISTSGNSENVIRAIRAAKEVGATTGALLGKDGGKLRTLVDAPIVVAAKTPDRIQEMHVKLIHTIVESVERQLFPEHYA